MLSGPFSVAALPAQVALGVALLTLMGCASAAAFREPISTDRPDYTEATTTVPHGVVQLEGGSTFTRASTVKTNSVGEFLLRIGAGPRAEIRIEPGSYTSISGSSDDASGWEDGALGAKFRLYTRPNDDPSVVPNVSLVMATSLPTGSRTFRVTHFQPEVKLANAWTIADRLDLSTNLVFSRPYDENGRYTELAASASFGLDLTERVGAFAEVFGFAPQISAIPHTQYFDTGVTIGLTRNSQLDFRGGVGLNDVGPDYFVGAGLAWRW